MVSKKKGEVIRRNDTSMEWQCKYCSYSNIDSQKVFNHILVNHPKENLNAQQEVKK